MRGRGHRTLRSPRPGPLHGALALEEGARRGQGSVVFSLRLEPEPARGGTFSGGRDDEGGSSPSCPPRGFAQCGEGGKPGDLLRSSGNADRGFRGGSREAARVGAAGRTGRDRK